MERCICPIAVLYFAVVLSLALKNVVCCQLVIKGTNFTTALYYNHFGSCNVISHMTIRSAVGCFL